MKTYKGCVKARTVAFLAFFSTFQEESCGFYSRSTRTRCPYWSMAITVMEFAQSQQFLAVMHPFDLVYKYFMGI